MISFDRVTVTYPGASTPTLQNVSLAIEEGHLALVIGVDRFRKVDSAPLRKRSRAPLLRRPSQRDGDSRRSQHRKYRPRDLADAVGYVGQDADASFVADTVEDELAYAMENLGVDPATMRRRVEDVLDTLNLHALRQTGHHDTFGWPAPACRHRRRLHRRTRALVLDEPTSSLDPVSAEEVLASLARLVHDQGTTILVAEHRLERIVQFADVVVELGAAPGGPQRHARGDLRHGPSWLRLSSASPVKPVGPQFRFRSETLAATRVSSAAASGREHALEPAAHGATSSPG